MRVLITTDLYRPSINGVVTSVTNLERELRDRGHEVKVLALSQSSQSSKEGPVYRAGSFSTGLIYPLTRFALRMPRPFLEEILRWRPDIVHSQGEFSTFPWARRIAKELKIPQVHSFHTAYEGYTYYFHLLRRPLRALIPPFLRCRLRSVDRIIVPTEKTRAKLAGYGIGDAVEVIPSGIDLKFFSGVKADRGLEIRRALRIPQGQKVALFLGRLAKEKNVEELLCFRQRSQNPAWTLVIAGGGPHEKALRSMACRMGLGDRVRFTGMIEPQETAGYFAAADFFLCSSTSETQGLTYAEALAAGLPLLCRDDPCLDGLLEQGVNGFRFTDFDGFQRGLEILFSQTGRDSSMSQRARKVAEKFSSGHFASRVEEIYRAVLSKRSA